MEYWNDGMMGEVLEQWKDGPDEEKPTNYCSQKLTAFLFFSNLPLFQHPSIPVFFIKLNFLVTDADMCVTSSKNNLRPEKGIP